ncbi:MAG: UDP-4-amino-4,6-dideoxy-N-acetyl-beta-L-altrosamine transaminase [Burkholderiales bacterium]|nr:UDP-4-amino-4,6-dideoxy-N-acetyl-beta-L-altrosamine transaminase [Burkholderiales bacterium]
MVIPYGKQTIDQDDIDAVVDVLQSDWLTQGPVVEEFESALSSYCGAKFALVFNSGTSALQAGYHATNLDDGDEIISSPLTFSATTNAALWFRAVPRFADIELSSGNIDIDAVEKLVSARTRVIAPVDFAGHPAALESLMELARRKNLTVLEDASHALGAKSKGLPVGGISDMTVFSFHPVKSITTGEGGALLTNNKNYYERAKSFRGHGIVRDKFVNSVPASWYYEMQSLGMNLRLTDLQCALGKSQLTKLPSFLHRRREIAQRYIRAFEDLRHVMVIRPQERDESSWHLFVVVLDGPYASKRDEIFQMLRGRGIGVQLHYMPVYKHPFYQQAGYANGLCPLAENLTDRMFSLPIFPELSEIDQGTVIEVFKDTLRVFE